MSADEGVVRCGELVEPVESSRSSGRRVPPRERRYVSTYRHVEFPHTAENKLVVKHKLILQNHYNTMSYGNAGVLLAIENLTTHPMRHYLKIHCGHDCSTKNSKSLAELLLDQLWHLTTGN